MTLLATPQDRRSILLKSLYLIEQPGQDIQTYRPMQATFNNNVANAVQNMAVGATTPNGMVGMISEAAAARVAPTILRPSDVPMGNLVIDNEWATKRYLIYADFECVNSMGIKTREVISAYTDHPGINVNTQSIDHNMRCYINNYMTYRNTTQQTSVGTKTITHVGSNAGVLANLKLEGGIAGTRSTGLRPSDAMASLSMLDVSTDDMRSCITDAPTALSNVNNSLVGHYLSSTLNAYNKIELDEVDSYGSDTTRYSLVGQELTDDSILNSAFYNFVSLRSNIAETGYFTMADILGSFPMRPGDGIYKINLLSKNDLQSLAGVNTSWSVASVEGRTLFGFTHSLPAILRKYMVRYYEFMVTDSSVTGVPIITPMGVPVPFFNDLHDPAKATLLDDALLMDIVNQMMASNIYGYHMKIKVNLFGNVSIDLSRNGGQTWVPFGAPVYCDRLTSPLRAANEAQAKTHARDIGTTIGTVFNGLQISNSTIGLR